MELIFEVVKTYDDFNMLDFTHDPDNLFSKFYKDGKYISSKSTEPQMGNFEGNLIFKKKVRKMTAQSISKFGVKNFPQYGSYGWYKNLISGESYVLVPIGKMQSSYDYPLLTVQQTSTDITITIIDPQTIAYEYYRLIFRQDLIAHEVVTSRKILTMPKLPIGEYELTAIGYADGDIVSKETVPMQVIIA